MKVYQIPVIQEKKFQSAPLFSQYGLTPICDTDLSRQCNSGGGETGFSCLGDLVSVTVFIAGASTEDSFPCEVFINGSSLPYSLDGAGNSDSCNGESGVVYIVNIDNVDCNSLSSVRVSCDTTVDCLDID